MEESSSADKRELSTVLTSEQKQKIMLNRAQAQERKSKKLRTEAAQQSGSMTAGSAGSTTDGASVPEVIASDSDYSVRSPASPCGGGDELTWNEEEACSTAPCQFIDPSNENDTLPTSRFQSAQYSQLNDILAVHYRIGESLQLS